MLNHRWAAFGILVLTVSAIVAGQSAKVYPGAKKYTPPDTQETRDALKAMPAGTVGYYYTTEDSFEKVVAFYNEVGKQYTFPSQGQNRKLPDGRELTRTFFIFDGAADLMTSKSWALIQRPFVRSVERKGNAPEYEDIRELTEIVITEKK